MLLNIIEDELGNLLGTIENKLNMIPAELGENDLDYIEGNLEYVLELLADGNTEGIPDWLLNTIEDEIIRGCFENIIDRNTGLNKREAKILKNKIESIYNTVKINNK